MIKAKITPPRKLRKIEKPMSPTDSVITPAEITWQNDDNGHIVPSSKEFGDVYYSVENGFAESRYVFLEKNDLANRFNEMKQYDSFTIAELGFGTGLNFFATWELWKQVRNNNNSSSSIDNKHLHFISFEKYPLTKADFKKSLLPWMETESQLISLFDKIIENYPTLVAGCHRINLYEDNVTLDLWFGDANSSLTKLDKSTKEKKRNVHTEQAKAGNVNAWFLDGFAPSCNQSLWAEQIFSQMAKLSSENASVATYSCAGVVKRGLTDAGFDIAKVKGFGLKNQMLTAKLSSVSSSSKVESYVNKLNPHTKPAAVIGAGVSGLMSAWALANRGVSVILIDKTAPLAGASGNPRGLLSPKMTPLHHVDEHLHSIGYLYSSRLFRQMDDSNSKGASNGSNQVLEPTGAMDLLIKSNIDFDKISAYPQDFAQVLSDEEAKKITGLQEQELSENQYLPQAGLINPQALANVVLAHPLVTFRQADITQIEELSETSETTGQVMMTTADGQQIHANHAIICMADKSCKLDNRIFDFRKIRGQLSWFTPTAKQLDTLPKIPLKYGGYCATFIPLKGDDKHNELEVGTPQFLLGASFVRNDMDSEIRQEEHQQSLDKLTGAITELKVVFPEESENSVKKWHGRVGIRAQTPDYHPLVGRVGDSTRIWTLSGMASKGYAYAPICAEVLADQIMDCVPPLSSTMLERLSPNRKRLQQAL